MKNKLKGKNFKKLKKRSKHWGYPIKFRSAKIRKQAKKKYKDTVFTKLFNNKAAAKHCIENGILREFLLKNETEVIVMLLGTYDEEMEKQILREEADERVARERAKGAKEKIKAIIDTLLDFGHSNKEILTALQRRLGVTEQQADEYLKKFYNKAL